MRILLSILLLLTFLPSWDGRQRLPLFGKAPLMTATPAPLDAAQPGLSRVGALTYLGGLVLNSPDAAFGGYSSLTVDGDLFTLLSDGGNIVRFRMGGDLQPLDVRFTALPDGPDTGWKKEERDSESMTRDPASGRIWVGFEGYNQIWRYAPGLARAETRVAPPAMADWDANGGAESMVRLRDGAFVVISETTTPLNRQERIALHFTGDPTQRPRSGFRFGYLPPAGYDPSDVTELPDGRLLVLNRRLALPFVLTAKLVIIDREAIRPGAVVKGREIATLAPPLLHDNFEGVAVTQEGGATILWLVSDDNQLFLQRTLLLKFRLEEPGASARRSLRPRPASSARRASGGAP